MNTRTQILGLDGKIFSKELQVPISLKDDISFCFSNEKENPHESHNTRMTYHHPLSIDFDQVSIAFNSLMYQELTSDQYSELVLARRNLGKLYGLISIDITPMVDTHTKEVDKSIDGSVNTEIATGPLTVWSSSKHDINEQNNEESSNAYRLSFERFYSWDGAQHDLSVNMKINENQFNQLFEQWQKKEPMYGTYKIVLQPKLK